jgi:Uma2 family endonuclease
LRPDARVELLDGLVVQMTPIGRRHASYVLRLTQLLSRVLAGRGDVSVQNPVILDDHSEPQPDVAVLRHRSDWYLGGLPRPEDVLLLVEVAHTTLDYDQGVKIPLYARSGIAEVWLVDLDAAEIVIYREPGPDGYALVRTAVRGETLTPLLLESVAVPVADILG